jgi:hypothetical protein
MVKQVMTAAQIQNAKTAMYGKIGVTRNEWEEMLDTPYADIAAQMYSNGATLSQMKTVVDALQEIEKLRK